MHLEIDPSSPDPLFDQIASALRGALKSGELKPGDHLPPAKAVASALRVNLHTVLRAYAILRDEGLIEVRRGRGSVVVDSDHATFRRRLDEAIGQVVTEARRLGLGPDEAADMVRRAF
ncbi:GntR family transcriptional regulator [Microbispora rosea subsp. aerata]|nr:GntR family transcriptional regulator [Microbispora rosea]GGO00616.1 GntR family transcriptional regulator [Microbispora rosea subsp. aerata]GIH56847.1 GntR family transcriptional regulator [Microbispora rosea subsp. aerata]GLJ84331.1 GntR family transcriptional regulator [Microbispora rosea subsp. aerata]